MNWEELVEVYTALDQCFKIQMLNLWMNWEKLYPNVSFTVENKIGIHIKRGRHILDLT